jgi:hypothetical protein
MEKAMKNSPFSDQILKLLRITLILVIVALNFGASGTKTAYAAAPSNDNFSGRKVIGVTPYVDTEDTTTATEEANDPQVPVQCDNKLLQKGRKTVWYAYTPGVTQSITMDTLGSTPSGYDTYISVWTGTYPSLTYVGCDDDNASNLQSQLTVVLQAGKTYFIEIAGYAGIVGGTRQPNPGGNLKFHLGAVRADTTGVFRPSNGLLYLKNTNTSGFADVSINYGTAGDYPVVGDWDNNGTVTIGVYRNGTFYLRNSNTVGFADLVIPFGIPGDQPIAGDWDGNGTDTIGVYRSSTGQFLLRNSNSAGPADYNFFLGNAGDVGIAGDWTGKGFDTTGVFRPSNGALYLKNTNTSGFADVAINYGIPGDQPVTGDWNADGKDTIGVYRNGQFLLRNSNSVGFADIVFALGNPGDMPIAGDWDGKP